MNFSRAAMTRGIAPSGIWPQGFARRRVITSLADSPPGGPREHEAALAALALAGY